MPWIRFEDNFDEHPKIVGLDDQSFRLYVRATAYAARHLTDGFVPRSATKALRANDWARCAGRLIRAGLWEAVEGGYRIHDYHDYQPKRAEIIEQRRKKAEAGRLGGKSGSKPQAEGKHGA